VVAGLPVSITHPKGWRDDAPEALALISERFGAEIPNDEGAVPRELWDLFQLANSCASHGFTQSEYALTGEKNSPYTMHWDALAEEHPYIAADPNGIMPDEGLSVTQILAAARNSGPCRWDLWNPSSPGFSPLKRPPGLARIDTQGHNFDVSAVFGIGDALPNAAAVSLDSWSKPDAVKEVPLLALDIDQAFEDYTGGILREQSGPSKGGHLGALWQHWKVGGERVFLFLTNWRLPKRVILSEARVRQARRVFRVRGAGK
jgi:hypothetical protein